MPIHVWLENIKEYKDWTRLSVDHRFDSMRRGPDDEWRWLTRPFVLRMTRLSALFLIFALIYDIHVTLFSVLLSSRDNHLMWGEVGV